MSLHRSKSGLVAHEIPFNQSISESTRCVTAITRTHKSPDDIFSLINFSHYFFFFLSFESNKTQEKPNRRIDCKLWAFGIAASERRKADCLALTMTGIPHVFIRCVCDRSSRVYAPLNHNVGTQSVGYLIVQSAMVVSSKLLFQ